MPGAQIIDGKAAAAAVRAQVAAEVARLASPPGLAVILVGDDPASAVYVRNKVRACEATGIRSVERRLPANATPGQVADTIAALNADPGVHGILLQLPLPAHLPAAALIQSIAPDKDVDGLTHINIGRLVAGDPGALVPCTPQGALHLIRAARADLSGAHAVVIGRSLLFGKPMGQLLLAQNCTVTQAHSRTRDLPDVCHQADILVAAVGQAQMVRGDWIKPGAVVIDVGINRSADGKLTGDVAFTEAVQVAGAITPVPGGVGPMTIAFLLRNTLRAARAQVDGRE
jgi:methylenetetrahydrofolate dehydrogenase (NADP+) / methenyltetrahydrofolate cyclohydrolase